MEVFDAEDDLGAAAFGVVGDFVDEELVHEAFEAVVFAVAEEGGAMIGVSYGEVVAACEGDEVSEDVWRAIRYVLRRGGWWSH